MTFDKLRQIEAAEAWLNAAGFPVCRVRHFGDTAKVEVPPERVNDLRNSLSELDSAFWEIGFARTEIDPEGFVSGKLNRVIGR